jgi:hypothetical protein
MIANFSSPHRADSFQRARYRQHVLTLIADIERAIGETERMLTGPLDDETLQAASIQLPALRLARHQLYELLNKSKGENGENIEAVKPDKGQIERRPFGLNLAAIVSLIRLMVRHPSRAAHLLGARRVREYHDNNLA